MFGGQTDRCVQYAQVYIAFHNLLLKVHKNRLNNFFLFCFFPISFFIQLWNQEWSKKEEEEEKSQN